MGVLCKEMKPSKYLCDSLNWTQGRSVKPEVVLKKPFFYWLHAMSHVINEPHQAITESNWAYLERSITYKAVEMSNNIKTVGSPLAKDQWTSIFILLNEPFSLIDQFCYLIHGHVSDLVAATLQFNPPDLIWNFDHVLGNSSSS